MMKTLVLMMIAIQIADAHTPALSVMMVIIVPLIYVFLKEEVAYIIP
jgi:hypothetical protein